MSIYEKFTSAISIVPIPSFAIQEASISFEMEVQATTEYIDLPQAIAGRLEGSVV